MQILLIYFGLVCLCSLANGLTTTEEASFIGSTTLTPYGRNNVRLKITHDGVPVNTTTISQQATLTAESTERIYRYPSKNANSSCVKQGRIGLTIDGVPIFTPLTGQGYNAVEGTHSEAFQFDECNGHNTPNGRYHHHEIPSCIYDDTLDKLIGVAFDGFPIYGPKSSLIDPSRNANAADLDECHGIDDGNGGYRYIVTYDFPYVIGCYQGDVLDGGILPAVTKICKETVTDALTEEAFKHWSGSEGGLCVCAYNYPADFDDAPTKRDFDAKMEIDNRKRKSDFEFQKLERMLKEWMDELSK